MNSVRSKVAINARPHLSKDCAENALSNAHLCLFILAICRDWREILAFKPRKVGEWCEYVFNGIDF